MSAEWVPIGRMGVDITACSFCGWQRGGDSVPAWRSHMAEDHVEVYATQILIVDAIRGHGTYDTNYEDACLRLAGNITRAMYADPVADLADEGTEA